MSGAEQIDSFNPFNIVIWLTELVILYIDYSIDKKISSFSVMLIGSIFFIQLYMIWKTNADRDREILREQQMQALGGPAGVPEIVPGKTNLSEFYKNNRQGMKPEKTKSKETIYLNSRTVKEE